MNWNKMMMECILAKDETEYQQKKKQYVEKAIEVLTSKKKEVKK